eukprot:scaffold1679_cov40-Cyclotella_meneghiniana.AAC.2
MAARYSFSGRLHGPQGVMVHPDLTGDTFYLQVQDGDSADWWDDMHSKYGFAGFRGIPNCISPAYLKPVFTDGGSWGAPVLLLKDGLERGFSKTWKEFHAIVGVSLSEADVTRCMYDVAFMESVLFQGTIVPMLSGLTECACHHASAACWWLGSRPVYFLYEGDGDDDGEGSHQ